MKGHMGRKHRETGGVNEAEYDENDKPEARTNATNIDREAEERKRGGRAHRASGGEAEYEHPHNRARGGHVKRRKRGGKTEVGKVEGHAPMHHAGRKPRASGGQTKEDREHEREGEERHERRERRDREHEREGMERRMHRARGGATSDANPFTSARKGEDGPGRKVMKGELGFGED